MPFFVFAVSAFLYLFQFIYLQQSIQSALHQTSNYFAKNAYLYEHLYDDYMDGQSEDVAKVIDALDLDEVISSAIYKEKFKSYLNEHILNLALVQGGIQGVNIQSQTDYFVDDELDLCAYYQCRIPIPIIYISPFDCIQRVKTQNWSGISVNKRYSETEAETDGEKEGQQGEIYITGHGRVYHTHKDCTHILLSVHKAVFSELDVLRNKQNEKYTKCEVCTKGVAFQKDSEVYITDEGDRYHSKKTCGGITRYVKTLYEIPENMRCCKRCQKRDKE